MDDNSESDPNPDADDDLTSNIGIGSGINFREIQDSNPSIHQLSIFVKNVVVQEVKNGAEAGKLRTPVLGSRQADRGPAILPSPQHFTIQQNSVSEKLFKLSQTVTLNLQGSRLSANQGGRRVIISPNRTDTGLALAENVDFTLTQPVLPEGGGGEGVAEQRPVQSSGSETPQLVRSPHLFVTPIRPMPAQPAATQQTTARQAPRRKVAIPSLASKSQQQAAPAQQQKVAKSADGKIQVQRLAPGQQLVQMPDGNLQIFSSQAGPSGAAQVRLAEASVLGENPASASVPALQLLPGATTPILRKPVQQSPAPGPQPQLTAKHGMIGIQSLGSNTVSVQDGKLIVQGQDPASAKSVASQLSSGKAKLGNVGGKQVLVIINQQAQTVPRSLAGSPIIPVQGQQQNIVTRLPFQSSSV